MGGPVRRIIERPKPPAPQPAPMMTAPKDRQKLKHHNTIKAKEEVEELLF